MSGVKKATVSHNLSRALKTVNEGLEQCASMAHSISGIGREEYENKKKDKRKPSMRGLFANCLQM